MTNVDMTVMMRGSDRLITTILCRDTRSCVCMETETKYYYHNNIIVADSVRRTRRTFAVIAK